jgi:hypothetical protein
MYRKYVKMLQLSSLPPAIKLLLQKAIVTIFTGNNVEHILTLRDQFSK